MAERETDFSVFEGERNSSLTNAGNGCQTGINMLLMSHQGGIQYKLSVQAWICQITYFRFVRLWWSKTWQIISSDNKILNSYVRRYFLMFYTDHFLKMKRELNFCLSVSVAPDRKPCLHFESALFEGVVYKLHQSPTLSTALSSWWWIPKGLLCPL